MRALPPRLRAGAFLTLALWTSCMADPTRQSLILGGIVLAASYFLRLVLTRQGPSWLLVRYPVLLGRLLGALGLALIARDPLLLALVILSSGLAVAWLRRQEADHPAAADPWQREAWDLVPELFPLGVHGIGGGRVPEPAAVVVGEAVCLAAFFGLLWWLPSLRAGDEGAVILLTASSVASALLLAAWLWQRRSFTRMSAP